ncbi:uroporphyrinogen-III synthase [Orbus sturtevantii]|uniref:uroporphyrinogen-III synthase n=1 Tax=Orbus sturtevantii TaxID=3074109 RepID=UPI00370D9520
MIIVTRPSPYGEELVQLCHQAKLPAKHLPFFNIIKGQDLDQLAQHLENLQQGDMIIIVSPQVNLMISTQQKVLFPHFVHYFAIGEQTAKQFQSITGRLTTFPPKDENSEGLLEYFQSINLSVNNRQVLILCGDVGRTVIKKNLTRQGALVKNIQCYQRAPICYHIMLFEQQQQYSFIITSIEHLLQLNQYCTDTHKHNCRIIVSSPRIMAEAKLHHWQQIYLAESANNQNLFKTIATLCHNAISI